MILGIFPIFGIFSGTLGLIFVGLKIAEKCNITIQKLINHGDICSSFSSATSDHSWITPSLQRTQSRYQYQGSSATPTQFLAYN